MVADDAYRESLYLRGDRITERLQSRSGPAPPVPALRSRRPFGEPGGLASFEQQFRRPQSSARDSYQLSNTRSMPALQVDTGGTSTRSMVRQSTALPRSRAVYDPILNQTSVFHIHNTVVDRQMSFGDDVIREAAHRDISLSTSYRGSFGHTGRRSPDIPSVRADSRRQKGLAENIVGLQHREMGGYDDPVPLLAPPRASPSPSPSPSPLASQPRSFARSPSLSSRSLLDHGYEHDRERFRHRMDDNIHDANAFHRGHRV